MTNPKNNQRRTIKSVILKELKNFPEGLNSKKLHDLVSEYYAVTRTSMQAVLALMQKQYLITIDGRSACEHCGVASTIYKLKNGNK